ncbi:MAG TPA: hypothetical protein VKU00_08485 [Chthonomonadaceae bacterium]|nr:hypothetical protein [Chthonomonadaceae bacterium]
MKTIRHYSVIAAALLLLGGIFALAQERPPTSSGPSGGVSPPAAGTQEPDAAGEIGQPTVSLKRVGPENVEGGQRVVLEQAVTDLFGTAWNFRNRKAVALIRPQGRQDWYVAGSALPEPGGVFDITDVRFPAGQDFELIVALANLQNFPDRTWIQESAWRNQPLSQRVSIHVVSAQSDPNPGAWGAAVAVSSVAGQRVDTEQATIVPPEGDVVITGSQLPRRAKTYLAVHVPSTDRCYLYGPGSAQDAESYRIPGVSLEAPGDPAQLHLQLVAFATAQPVRAGPISWQSFQHAGYLISPAVEITVEGLAGVPHSDRIPYVAITRIGKEDPQLATANGGTMQALQGDSLEVSAYARIPEGALPFALTRLQGDSTWLCQGPMILRGAPQPPALQPTQRLLATWVLPSLRFEAPAQTDPGQGKYEVMVVFSTATLGNSWLDSASLTGQYIKTCSQIVLVRVGPVSVASPLHPVISRVGNRDVEPGGETPVEAKGSVEVDLGEELPAALKVYVGTHPVGENTWSFVEAIPNGKTCVVPDLMIADPNEAEGTRHQLIAIITRGDLPVLRLEYPFTRYAASASDTVTVAYRHELLPTLTERFSSWVQSMAAGVGQPANTEISGAAAPTELEGSRGMSIAWWIIPLALLVIAILLEVFLSAVSIMAGQSANRMQRLYRGFREWLSPIPKPKPGHFLLGVVLLIAFFYYINHYLPFYTAAIAGVFEMSKRESGGLAIGLVVITAVVGVLIDIFYRRYEAVEAEATQRAREEADRRAGAESQPPPLNAAAAPGNVPASAPDPRQSAPPTPRQNIGFYELLTWLVGFLAIGLLVFQGGIYFQFYRKAAGGSLPIFGALKAFCFACAEILTLFAATELALNTITWLMTFLFLAPFYTLEMVFRFVSNLFGLRPRRRRAPEPEYAVVSAGPASTPAPLDGPALQHSYGENRS